MRVLSERNRAVPDTSKRNMVRQVFAASVMLSATCLGIEGLGNAEANGETRALTIQHMHTHETATITYKSGGQFTRDGLDKLNWMLRDWRRDEPIAMDPRLFDVVWEATRATGSSGPIHVVSGYRSSVHTAIYLLALLHLMPCFSVNGLAKKKRTGQTIRFPENSSFKRSSALPVLLKSLKNF
jgi:hypothetical protein